MRANKSSSKLSKKDPDFYSKIAKIAGEKLLKERGKEYFSSLAARFHPRGKGNYHGGRPRKTK